MNTTTTTKNNTKKTVRFNESVRCKFVLHNKNYTEEEHSNAFMSHEDMQAIKADIRSTLRAINDGAMPMQRGLESRTREASERRSALKHHARTTVLDEQADQKVAGDHDPDFIASMYQQVSKKSQKAAAMRGKMDEEEAEMIRGEDIISRQQRSQSHPDCESYSPKTISLASKLRSNPIKPLKSLAVGPIRMFIGKAA
eukprot:CAMPEP_0198132926 /NCGR_PEP_ID=MMETSP1442-20131203/59300_1 /TAXON_ID= /ORGANISM="Craspedostauros australis, Strain CCMP3328" /LENGTH=197 /DNA_ID=CAMNT_0043794029 /DNA_START=93 /DNA_END=686 /DNA_ORIENTATION=+